MKTMIISEFKAKCIAALKNTARTREPILITLRGKPLASVEPVQIQSQERVLGGLASTMRIEGDIVNSDFADDWETDQK